MGTLYVHAAVGRAGLGNMLVPWARAEVFREQTGARMLAPQWTQVKLGPLLRRERDLRLYSGLFDNSGYVRGARRLAVLALAQRIAPEEFERSAGARSATDQLVVHRFSSIGLGGLGPHRGLISRRLNAILRPSVRAILDSEPPGSHIVLHVRRGDRPPLPLGVPFGDDWLPGMPEEWFVGALRHVRTIAGREVRATVFTDARPEQIRALLNEPSVSLAPPNPSIVDMLLLARGSVLIGTGSSSFSAWAAMLGGMPTLYYPGLLERLELDYATPVRTDLGGRVVDGDAPAVRNALQNA